MHKVESSFKCGSTYCNNNVEICSFQRGSCYTTKRFVQLDVTFQQNCQTSVLRQIIWSVTVPWLGQMGWSWKQWMELSNSRDDDKTWLVKTSFLVRLTEIGNLSETCFSKIKRYFKWDGITINKTTLLLTSEFRQKKVICVLRSGRTEFLYWKQQRRKKKRFRELAIWWCQQLEKNFFFNPLWQLCFSVPS